MSDITMLAKAFEGLESTIAAHQRELADRVLQLEQKGVLQPGGTPPAGGTLGADFANEFAQHRESFKRNRAISLEVSTKGLISAVQVGTRMSLGATPGGDLPATLPAVAMRSIPLAGAQSLIYARRTGVVLGEDSAGVQNGEGAAKTERTPEYTSITQNRATVAGYANLSEQALSSDLELRTAIDVFLQTDVLRAASVLLVNGTAVASAAFSGFRALAVESLQTTGILTPGAPEVEIVAARGALQMRAQGYNPTLMIVDPLNWGQVVTRYGDEGWFNGSPFDMPPLMFAGMRVCFSEAVDANEPLLVDERYAHWAIADTMRVDLGYVNDGFIKNIVTVRAEMGMIPILRDAHAVWRVKKLVE